MKVPVGPQGQHVFQVEQAWLGGPAQSGCGVQSHCREPGGQQGVHQTEVGGRLQSSFPSVAAAETG